MVCFILMPKMFRLPLCLHIIQTRGGSTPLISCDQSSKVCRILIFSSGKSVFQLGNTLYAPMHGDALLIKDHTEYIAYFYPDSCPDYYEMSFPIAFFECLSAPNPFHTLFYEPDKRKSNLIHLNHTECDNILHKLHHQIMSIS